MALPTPTKTWQYSRNNTVAAQGSNTATCRRILRSIKNTMIGFASNPWTVSYSCNSVTAGTAGDGIDRWTADADLVGSSIAAKSWIVLRQTGIATNFEICIDLSSSSLSSGNITISPSAGFTGGTTSARPTATDEIPILPANSSFGLLTTDTQHRYSVLQSTDGQSTIILTAASGSVLGFYVFQKPTNTTTGWTNPSVNIAYTSSTSILLTFAITYNLWKTRIGSVLSTIELLVEGNAGGIGPTYAPFLVANEVDSAWPIWSIGFCSPTSTVRGRHGNLVDIWIGSNTVVTGEGYPNDGTNSFIQIGHYIIPWGGDSTLLSLT